MSERKDDLAGALRSNRWPAPAVDGRGIGREWFKSTWSKLSGILDACRRCAGATALRIELGGLVVIANEATMPRVL